MIIFNIKKIRENKELSIRRLSQLTGISRTYLSDLENNCDVNPTVSILEKIAKALDVNIKTLFYSELDIEELRKEMHRCIDKYGLDSKEVLEISQLIDLLLNINGTIRNS